MPELPEVEAARKILAGALEGARVAAVLVADPRVVTGGAHGLDRLLGARGERVERRGKRLRVTFEGERGEPGELFAFAHLGMSGRWQVVKPKAAPLAHELVRFDLTRGRTRSALAYVDPRRFGRIVVADVDIPAWRQLGPDPLHDGIDPPALLRALNARRRSVKEALLDQRILAGVGNIHAIESLWRAQIDPRSRTDALTLVDARALAKAIRASLAFGLKQQPGDRVEYVEDAGARNPYRIYDRKGPCPRCGHPLAKIVMGGRGTTFCSGCQRLIR